MDSYAGNFREIAVLGETDMLNDFEMPSRRLLWLSQVGGVVTAIVMIAGLRSWVSFKTPQAETITALAPSDVAKLDATSGEQAAAAGIDLKPLPREFSEADLAIAKKAWRYFQTNWNPKTGFVNSERRTASTTMSEVAVTLAALVSAKELNLIDEAEFDSKMGLLLKTLTNLPLYRNQLPNEVYNAKTGDMIAPGQLDKVTETGWSALDMGRLARWLKIVGDRHPKFRPQTQALWKSWQVEFLTQKGQIYRANLVQGEEQYKPQGRLGKEEYAAYGFKIWGLPVEQSLNNQSHRSWVTLYGQKIPVDSRPSQDRNANDVSTDAYFLDGLESGFQAVPKSDADRILSAQIARYQATHQLTAVATDQLDRAPGMLTNTLYGNRQPWASLANQQNYSDFRFLSAKAAFAWDAIYHTEYTQSLVSLVKTKLETNDGWYTGYYEVLQQPNQVLTAETNGVILESLLYRKVNKPLMQWASGRDR